LKVTPGIVYEENLLWTPYQAKHSEGHAWLKILGRDPESGAAAALIKYEAGYKAPAGTSKVFSDTLYIQGELRDGSSTCKNLTYVYRPAGTRYGPTEAKEDTVKFMITGGKGEKSSSKGVFVGNVDGGPWDEYEYYPFKDITFMRTLRIDKVTRSTIGWAVFPKVALSYPNKSMVHDVAEEAFCVDGENIDYYGDVEGFVKWRRGAYFHRPPFMARHGHSLKTSPPFKVFMKHYSLKAAEAHDIKEGFPSTFTE